MIWDFFLAVNQYHNIARRSRNRNRDENEYLRGGLHPRKTLLRDWSITYKYALRKPEF
jgi:hypothetical protein